MGQESVRQAYESLMDSWLAPYATRVSAGRAQPLTVCDMRTDFQRDRDRILHCKAFRRLTHKTQVFVAAEGDYYRTRLTHTLEVSQIARTIARGLRLNEDLTEAIALGHDLGHTPFGHIGERCLDQLTPFPFRHNEQGVRVVERLENGKGLNLTQEVRDGILHHRRLGTPATPEGCVVQLADKIAYINHDIDDAMRAGYLQLSQLPAASVAYFGITHGQRIAGMVSDVLQHSHDGRVVMSPEAERLMLAFMLPLNEWVYRHEMAAKQEEKALELLNVLYRYYLAHPRQIAGEYRGVLEQEGPERAVCDFIAGMTDRYAIRTFSNITIPTPFD